MTVAHLAVHTCCIGLDACKELRQLHTNDCGMSSELGLTACRVLRQVTELRLQDQVFDQNIISFVAEAMPQLVILDISFDKHGWAITSCCWNLSDVAPPVAAFGIDNHALCATHVLLSPNQEMLQVAMCSSSDLQGLLAAQPSGSSTTALRQPATRCVRAAP